MLAKNQLFTVTIDDINNLGYGICRIDGIVTFVREAVTGDHAEIRIIKVARDYAVAIIETLLTPSPYRRESDCPVSRRCGGCVFRHVDYAYELTVKKEIVRSAFRKNGMPDVTVHDVITTGHTDGYRNKVVYPVDENGRMGFYAEHSHDIVEHDICLLQSRTFDPCLQFLRDYLKRHPLKGLRYVCLRYGQITGEHVLCFVVKNPSFRFPIDLLRKLNSGFQEITAILLNYNTEDTNVIFGPETRVIYNNDFYHDNLCGLQFRVSCLSFYQVNHDAAELLYRKAAELADLQDGEHLVDLFCGAGTIGLTMAKDMPGCRLTGVEINPASVENARYNAALNGIENAEFICGDASDAAVDDADVIVLDPPRRGCDRSLIERIAATRVRRVVYVSCDPATLARDAALFASLGFTVGDLWPHDLFPRTGHVETVVLMSRA